MENQSFQFWEDHLPQSSSSPSPITSRPQRSLPRQRSRYLRPSGSQHSSEPIPIPIPHSTSDSTLGPMQRWQESPPETEAASLEAIAGALHTTLPHFSSCESLRSRAESRAASTRSLNSNNTGHSSGSIASTRSTTSRALRRRRQNNRVAKTKQKGSLAKDRRPFQCTFCCDSFKSKYDWSRHEKSRHLSLERWVCTPHGGAVMSLATGRSHCAYCNILDPTPEHLDTHSHDQCQSSGQPHTFNRKDHLVQHLRLVHHLDVLPVLDDWKLEAPPMSSRCGFCDKQMTSWPERVDHLAQHFRKGKTMLDWKGDHCFEPSIAAQVTNALPPYLIGQESNTVVPFSATSIITRDHLSQIRTFHQELEHGPDERDPGGGAEAQLELPDVMQSAPPTETFVKLLTLRLGRFAQQHMSIGIIPTDDMFQAESRRLLYGSEDGWEQTIADNDQWLADFRNQHIDSNSGSI
ncbi:hypothetical protein B0T10DRAFT_413412 [Thelonectria olida]|uniref:C2H2-type domain-containing protein n=1 Tax=Thelonectria olida TaxID=1576542 RepID=A0A9P9AGX0_9HYPO|nr:hypothetical protein B0T10DRAFT_413412 [Thelonectria olida]